jgi:hypothetical protein
MNPRNLWLAGLESWQNWCETWFCWREARRFGLSYQEYRACLGIWNESFNAIGSILSDGHRAMTERLTAQMGPYWVTDHLIKDLSRQFAALHAATRTPRRRAKVLALGCAIYRRHHRYVSSREIEFTRKMRELIVRINLGLAGQVTEMLDGLNQAVNEAQPASAEEITSVCTGWLSTYCR